MRRLSTGAQPFGMQSLRWAVQRASGIAHACAALGRRALGRRALGCTVLCCAVLGCSAPDEESTQDDQEAANPTFRAGDRLRPVVYTGGDESEVLRYFIDTELNTDCQFRSGEEGPERFRCTPRIFAEVFYADADCQEPLVSTRTTGCDSFGEGALVVGHLPALEPCSPIRMRSFEVGPSVTVETPYWLSFATGQCEPAPNADPSMLHSAVEVPQEEFVLATLELEGVAEGFARSVVVGTDGSRQSWEMAHGGKQCFPETVSGRLTCLPGPSALLEGQYSSEASCGQGDVYLEYTSEQCPLPEVQTVLGLSSSGQCPTIDRVLSPGVEVSGAVYMTETGEAGEQCVETGPAEGYRYVSVGAEQPLESLPALHQVALGEGEARPVYYATPDGIPLVATGEWWNASGAPCNPTLLMDGVMRCVPYPRPVSYNAGYYLDAECSRPAYMESLEFSPCHEGELLAMDYAPGCGVLAMHRLVPVDGPGYRLNETGGCDVVEAAELDVVLYSQGELIDLDALPLVTEVRGQ